MKKSLVQLCSLEVLIGMILSSTCMNDGTSFPGPGEYVIGLHFLLILFRKIR